MQVTRLDLLFEHYIWGQRIPIGLQHGTQVETTTQNYFLIKFRKQTGTI